MSDSENTVVEEKPQEETPAPEDIGEVTKITPPKIKPTKGTECNHPLNDSGYHHKTRDGTCRYCGQ